MEPLNRRDFLQLGARLSALFGMGTALAPQLAHALEEMASGTAPVLWLQGQSCSGCSVALLDSEGPTPARLLTQYISLKFHQTLSTATGHQAVEIVNTIIEAGGYILCAEGSVPAGMPKACVFGEETYSAQLSRAAKKAKAVLAVGTCASHGGIPAAENNPTGSVSVPAFFSQQGITTPTIRLPGCPTHPDWLLGTIAHVLKAGLPPLDGQGRPQAFYGRLVHDQCPRFADYERERFAQKLGDGGCLFKLGCLGPITHADCNLRLWNGGVNACIRAGAPCIGCASSDFAAKAGFPMLTRQTAKDGQRA